MRNYTAILKYDSALADKVSMYYAQRQFGRSTILCVFVLAAAMGFALFYGFDQEFFEIIGLSVASCLGFYFWYRWEIRRRWKDTVASMGKPEAQLVVDEENFTVSSGAGSVTIPWKQFSNMWKKNEYWLLFIRKDTIPVTLPLDGVDPKALDLIEEKILAAKKSKDS